MALHLNGFSITYLRIQLTTYVKCNLCDLSYLENYIEFVTVHSMFSLWLPKFEKIPIHEFEIISSAFFGEDLYFRSTFFFFFQAAFDVDNNFLRISRPIPTINNLDQESQLACQQKNNNNCSLYVSV